LIVTLIKPKPLAFIYLIILLPLTHQWHYRPAIPKVHYSESPLCRYAPQC